MSPLGPPPLKPQTEPEEIPYEPGILPHSDSESDVCVNSIYSNESKEWNEKFIYILYNIYIFSNQATRLFLAVKLLSEVTIMTAVNITCVLTGTMWNLNVLNNYTGTRYFQSQI